jgi:hypothetical protein
MALVSANQLSLEKTLEELIKEFNALRGDVTSVTLETLITAASAQIVFEGATSDDNETSLTVVDPLLIEQSHFQMQQAQLLQQVMLMLVQPQQHLLT